MRVLVAFCLGATASLYWRDGVDPSGELAPFLLTHVGAVTAAVLLAATVAWFMKGPAVELPSPSGHKRVACLMLSECRRHIRESTDDMLPSLERAAKTASTSNAGMYFDDGTNAPRLSGFKATLTHVRWLRTVEQTIEKTEQELIKS